MQITIDRGGDDVWYMMASEFFKLTLSSEQHTKIYGWTNIVSAGLYSIWGQNPNSKTIYSYPYSTKKWASIETVGLRCLEADPLSNLIIRVDTNGQLLKRSDVEENNMFGSTWEEIPSEQTFKYIKVYNISILGIDDSSQLYLISENHITLGMEWSDFIYNKYWYQL